MAHAKGMQVLVTDHHLPGETLPAAEAIVNPNLRGCAFPSKSLAGVGVAFYLMLALRARLRDSGWFEQRALAMPNLAELLDLVALGTVADVVPLDANNRILVYQGLNRIRAGKCRPGIRALLEVANRDARQLAANDLGFALGPRLNAAGRLDDMSIGGAAAERRHRAGAYAGQRSRRVEPDATRDRAGHAGGSPAAVRPVGAHQHRAALRAGDVSPGMAPGRGGYPRFTYQRAFPPSGDRVRAGG